MNKDFPKQANIILALVAEEVDERWAKARGRRKRLLDEASKHITKAIEAISEL